MTSKELKNKPLVEAILEVRWALCPQPPNLQGDPHYKILLARLFDRMIKEYPEHEQLPAANVPDIFVGHVVQHRFRVARNKWPLFQVGPGVLTVNSTDDYTWSDFRRRILSVITELYNAHPKVEDFKVTNLILRYIDAVHFDYLENNSFAFLRDMLKLSVSFPSDLFSETGVADRPCRLTWHTSFECDNPDGIVNLRFASGQKNAAPAIVWEITLESSGHDIPSMPTNFKGWIDAAHTVTDDWFFKLIAGELERRFSSD